MLVPIHLTGQLDTLPVTDASSIENIVENDEVEGDLDLVNALEELEFYRENPLNLNQATYDDLSRLRLLSEIQIIAFIQYREELGPLVSIYELQAVPGWDVPLIQSIRPFVTLTANPLSKSRIKELVSAGDHVLFLKWKRVLSERQGFIPNQGTDYQGDPNHLYVRYRYNYQRRLRWGLTAEKDPGEPFFKTPNSSGFDFYSGFIHYENPNHVLKLISLGDYTLSMGQGLITHNNFGTGKSSQVIQVVKGGFSVRPYSSVNETNFMRGVTTTLRWSKLINTTLFVSRKNISGNVRMDTTIDTGFEQFSSISLDGYHRTDREIERKNQIQETAYGGIIRFQNEFLRISGNFLSTRFDKAFFPREDLYRTFRFRGTQLRNMSVDAIWQWNQLNLFSELARSDNGGKSWLVGSQMILHPRVDLALVYRNYGRDYQVLRPNAFGEFSHPSSEKGIYLAVTYRAGRQFLLSAYHDVWVSPWLRFRVDAPSDGKESFIRLDYKRRYHYHFYIQYKYENKARNITLDQPIREIRLTDLHRLRAHINYTLNTHLEGRTRVEFSNFMSSQKKSTGWLIYQDFIYRPGQILQSLSTRFALFDTDDFDSRIYAYENDLLYEFRIPFYQYAGFRFYLNSRWKLSRKFVFEFRIENTILRNREEIGSGGETITGNSRSEIKTQIKYQF